ncbi:hypothetical protein BC826DRAFT_1174586 [Russula brevipes]|nr:hypothetical protein BC826DRAFT_1174586 [Russula brevipes]
MAACALVLKFAGRGSDLQCLLGAGINPFFIIYACADCDCWRGLGAERTAIQNSTGGGELPSSSDFSQENEDPEASSEHCWLSRSRASCPSTCTLAAGARAVHRDHRGSVGAKCKLGRLWYDANNLADKDVAPFAMLNTLTRVLPHWSSGILQINTNDVRLLWGVCGGPPSGAWTVIGQICRSHHIQLRAKWAALKSYEICLPADPVKREALVQYATRTWSTLS